MQSSQPGSPGPDRAVLVGSIPDLLLGLLDQGLAPLLVALVLLIAGLAGLGMFLRSRRRGTLFFALHALVASGIVVARSPLTPLVWDAPVLLSRLMVFSAAFFMPALGAFFSEFLPRGRAPWFVRALQVSASIASLLFFATLFDEAMIGQVLPALAIFVPANVALCAVVLAKAVRAGDLDARIILAGALVLAGTVLFDAAVVLGLHRSEQVMSVHWGFLALAAVFAVVLARGAEATTLELASRTRAIEAHQEDVRRLAERMAAGAGELVAVVVQLHASGSAQSDGLARQAAALHQTQVTAEEIKRTSEMVATKAQALLEATADAESVGHAGEQALGSSLSGLEAIGQEVAQMAQRAGGMQSRAREIAGIVETVKALADQSNMLALNAAIEAVRSGEHGKGFGVVAREVRSLADQSLQAVSRIQQVLAGVSDSIRDTVSLSQTGAQRVEAGLEQVRASAEQLRRMIAISRETSASGRQISAAVTQQNAGVAEIFAAVDDLSRQMQDTLERVREAASATRLVQRVAESLKDMGAQAGAADRLIPGSLEFPTVP